MSQIKFTSAVLTEFKRTADNGTAKFSASLTQSVCEALEWTEMPTCFTSGDVEGDLAATIVEIKPNDKQLEKHALELDVNRVNRFQIVRREIEGKRGKGTRLELHFLVTFVDLRGARKLEEYLLTIGEGKSTLSVNYTKQEKLPGTSDADAEKQQELLATVER